MNLDRHETVGKLVSEHPEWAATLERLGIDYCCGGKKPIGEACAEKGLDVEQVASALATATVEPASAQVNWSQAPLAKLCDHIEQVHHAYLKSELPRLSSLMDKLVEVHSSRHPELVEVRRLVQGLRLELEAHLAKEETILFPAIRGCERNEGPSEFHCGGLSGPISVMEHEHDDAGIVLARLREITDNYRVPADGCATYRATFGALEELEADLHQHIHKENNILFPRARAMASQPDQR